MFPRVMKSKFLNRTLEINMIQALLKHGLANEYPVVLSDFWRTIAEEANLNGSWTIYKNHFNKVPGKRVEQLSFIDQKFRALIMYVANIRVSDRFKQELINDNCVCLYDDHSRIISIHSDDNEIVKSGRHRKVAKKDAPKCDKVVDVRDTEENVKTVGMFYDKVKLLLDSLFERKRLDYKLNFGLQEDAKQKEVSNYGLLLIIEKLAKNVVESEDEVKNGPK